MEISFECLLSEEELGNYEEDWSSREENLRHYIIIRGSRYKSNTESLHSSLMEHIGTSKCDSNLVIKHKHFKNGRYCCQK